MSRRSTPQDCKPLSWRTAFRSLGGRIFPELCLGCGRIRGDIVQEEHLQRRRAELPSQAEALHPWLCASCASLAPTADAEQVLALRSGRRAAAAAVDIYEGPLGEVLRKLKFSGEIAWAGPLGQVLAQHPRWRQHEGVVIPVPLHPFRLLQRGFNQSQLIASAAADDHPLPLRPRWLRRVRPTRAQHRLGRSERAENLRGAFQASASARGQDILLIDDVLTTGATMRAAQEALTRAGAQSVRGLCLVREL